MWHGICTFDERFRNRAPPSVLIIVVELLIQEKTYNMGGQRPEAVALGVRIVVVGTFEHTICGVATPYAHCASITVVQSKHVATLFWTQSGKFFRNFSYYPLFCKLIQ